MPDVKNNRKRNQEIHRLTIMKITRYIHRPNLTELGMGNTNETYMLIGGGIDLSSVFPVGVDTNVVDQTKGKKIKTK